MAYRSKRPPRPFDRTASDFARFRPAPVSWEVESLPLAPDPIEPNILAYLVKPQPPTSRWVLAALDGPVLVRLVHGYNLRDCLRIKGFKVDLIGDWRDMADRRANAPSLLDVTPRIKAQAWRVTSSAGAVTLFVTSILREGDFEATDVDTRAMLFPRVGVPDEAGWVARGMTLESLRRPIASLRRALRGQWNSSRSDLATFLHLKQPAWASDSLYSLVSAWRGPSVDPVMEGRVAVHLLAVHTAMATELRTWRARELGDRRRAHPSKVP
jgi:hypothetical protein